MRGIILILSNLYYFEIISLLIILLIAAISDIKTRKVSNLIILSGIACRLLFLLIDTDFISNVICSLLNAVFIAIPLFIIVSILEKIYKKQLMGAADIKLIFLCGMFLDFEKMLYVLLFAFLFALVFAILQKIKKRNKAFPFVPFLLLSVVINLLPGTI